MPRPAPPLHWLYFFVLLVLLGAAPPPLEAGERAVCRAVEYLDNPPVINGPWPEPPPVLIVLGNSKVIRKNETGEHDCRLEVEETLYGDREIKTVEYTSSNVRERRAIYFLRPGREKGELAYVRSDDLDLEDLPAVRALCTARLTAQALSADAIFVGEAVRSDPEKWEVKVVEHVSGSKLPLNEAIRMEARLTLHRASAPPAGQCLYLVRVERSLRPDGPATFRLVATLPLHAKPEVLAAVGRRESYPRYQDGPYDIREVLFDGTADEAVKFLHANHTAVQLFGQRYFVHHGEEARRRLAPLIEATWMEFGSKERGKYYDQKLRIETIGMAERQSPVGALAALAEKLIGRLEALPPKPGESNRPPDTAPERWREEEDTDANHSLTWLLREMDEMEVARRWETRLSALKERHRGAVRDEVTLAIDVMRLESNRELRAALARMEGIQPVRSDAGMRHSQSIRAVAFSPDGEFVATSGDGETRVWHTRDWQPAGTLAHSGEQVAFSPDAKFLYLAAGGRNDGTVVSRYEWRTGRLDQTFQNPSFGANQMDLPRDGRTLLTASYMDGSLILWDTATGRKRRQELLPSVSSAAALSPDGKWLTRRMADPPGRSEESEVAVETVDGTETLARIRYRSNVHHLAFTPDGAHLVATEEGTQSQVTIHKLGGTPELVAKANFGTSRFVDLSVSPDGKFVTASDEFSGLSVFSVPKLEAVWKTRFMEHRQARGVSLSPDGRWLIAANGQPVPHLYRMNNFDEIIPSSGHHEGATFWFSGDSRRLWSMGRDGILCHWDAARMKIIDRQAPPEKSQLASTQEPEGKYALFIVGMPYASAETGTGIEVLDMETGKTVSKMDFRLRRYENVHWLPGGQLLTFGDAMSNRGTAILDFLHAKVIHQFPKNMPALRNSYLSADQRSVLYDYNYKAPGRPTHRFDLTTGAESEPKIEGGGRTLTANGETYTLLGGAGVPEKFPEVRGVTVDSYILSPDERRLAIVTGQRIERGKVVRRPNEDSPTMVRIHDAQSLRMICAIQAATRRATVRFNPDGTQILVTREDGIIERWPLPD